MLTSFETVADIIEWQNAELERRQVAWERFYRECADVVIATRGEAPPHALDEADHT